MSIFAKMRHLPIWGHDIPEEDFDIIFKKLKTLLLLSFLFSLLVSSTLSFKILPFTFIQDCSSCILKIKTIAFLTSKRLRYSLRLIVFLSL